MKSCTIFVVLFLLFFITSCSTVVDVDVTRPATLDIQDARSIYIEEFLKSSSMITDSQKKNKDASIARTIDNYTSDYIKPEDEERIIYIIDRELKKTFSNSNFTVLEEPERESLADIIIFGGITYVGSNIDSEIKTQKEKNGTVTRTQFFWRNVVLAVEYSIYDNKNSTLLQTKEAKYTLKSDEYNQKYLIPQVFEVVEPQIKYLAADIKKQFQTYKITKELKLLYHKDTEMKSASLFAQSNDLDSSLSLYQKIYNTKGYFEAGYNTAIIISSMGDNQRALEIMQELYNIYEDKRALEAADDFKREIQFSEKLKSQM